MTIKHFQTKSGRYTTAIVHHVGKRTLYDFDQTKVQLALAIVANANTPNIIEALCDRLGVLSKGSLLTVNSDWEIDI